MRFFRSVRLRASLLALGVLLAVLLLVLLGAIFRRAKGDAVSASQRVSGAPAQETSVPVLIVMYHSILRDASRAGQYVISPEVLAADLAWLKSAGYTAVFPSELIAYTKGGTLPEKPVILSFDDGYYNNYLYAYPMMEEYGMKMTLAVIGAYADQYSEVEENNAYYSHCTWTQLKEMTDSGRVELANHSYQLHTYNAKRHGCSKNAWEALETYHAMLCEDILRMQNRTREQTGLTLSTFVYPFGSYCSETCDIIRELGFCCTFSCESGVALVSRDPACLFEMKRNLRPSGISSAAYFKKILR